MRIHVLALNGVFDTGLVAVLDAFGIANTLAERPIFPRRASRRKWWGCGAGWTQSRRRSP